MAEAVYLSEKGRIDPQDYQRLLVALADPESELTVLPFGPDHAAAMPQVPRGIVPDMPDRMLAATAMHLRVHMVTRDARIRAVPGLQTIW